MEKLLDTSNEFLISPLMGGVKLVKPSDNDSSNNHCVGSTLNQPFNVFFLDKGSIIQNINETTIISCNYPSVKKTIGRDISLAAKSSTALQSIKDNLDVITNGRMKVCEENFIRKDDVSFSATSLKFPWYNDNNQIIGVFGCAIVMGENSNCGLAYYLNQVIEMGLLVPGGREPLPQRIVSGREINGVYLSKRELECLKYLTMGNTSKMTAKLLGVSPRTIECHIENIRTKFNVHSKYELLSKVRNHI